MASSWFFGRQPSMTTASMATAQQDVYSQVSLETADRRASPDYDDDAAGPAWLEHAPQFPQYHGDYASGDDDNDEPVSLPIELVLPDPLTSSAPFCPSTFDMEHPIAPRSSRAVTPSSEDRSSSVLHSLTERKLEKAVMGRAVGLRQLVLLSNAFASRFTIRADAQAQNGYDQDRHSFAQPGPSDLSYYSRLRHRHDADQEELESLEDAVYRKRKEEDWLDAVLDEMLTDEEEAETYQNEPRLISKGPAPEFIEPYVHLSIRDGSQSRQSSAEEAQSKTTPELPYADDPPTPLHTLASGNKLADVNEASVPILAIGGTLSTSPLSALALTRDSGFLEPAAIPLPISPDRSPAGSSSSAQSDDGNTTVGASDGDDRTEQQGRSDDGQEDDIRPDSPQWGPISITGASLTESMLMGEANTPDLAYSVNSFFSNLSSSTSASVHLQTPSSTPPMFSSLLHERVNVTIKPEAEQDPLLEAEEMHAYDDDLAIEMDGVHDDRRAEDVRTEHTPQLARPGATLDLVKYQYPEQYASKLDLSALSRLLPVYTEPRLPEAVLSGIVGKRDTYQPSAKRPKSPPRMSDTFSTDCDSLRLPLTLPYDTLKCLYDSVDFGVPSAQSPLESPVQSPRLSSSSLPPTSSFGFAAFGPGHLALEMVDPPLERALHSTEPGVPRTRSKSMSGLTGDLDAQILRSSAEQQARSFSRPTSGGGVLFRSLGLLFRGGSARSFDRKDNDVDPNLFSKAPQTTERERCRPSVVKPFGAHFGRSDSRSPSRLRIHNYSYGNSQGDFDFGSA